MQNNPLEPPRDSKKSRRVRRLLGALLLTLVVALLLLAFLPLRVAPLVYRPLPERPYAETVSIINGLIRNAPKEVRPECRGRMLVHGRRTEHVFVLMHGLSNCPAQFGKFGELLYSRGHNVVIPRLPYHGQQDRMTEDWKDLSAQMMLDSANNAVDAAKALGRKVTVVGLSINATTAAWLAQNRADIQQVVLLAPFLCPNGVPEWAMPPLSRLIYRLPNRFMWWDPIKKDRNTKSYAYPRFPTHSIAQVMRIGTEVLEHSEAEGPRCGSILVVTTGSEKTANNDLTRVLVERWYKRRPGAVRTFEFLEQDQVGHDFIDPTQPNQKVATVYPKLVSLIFEAD